MPEYYLSYANANKRSNKVKCCSSPSGTEDQSLAEKPRCVGCAENEPQRKDGETVSPKKGKHHIAIVHEANRETNEDVFNTKT
jgi:hypothetical protein